MTPIVYNACLSGILVLFAFFNSLQSCSAFTLSQQTKQFYRREVPTLLSHPTEVDVVKTTTDSKGSSEIQTDKIQKKKKKKASKINSTTDKKQSNKFDMKSGTKPMKKKRNKQYQVRKPLKFLKLGSEIEGTVVEIKPYGAFVQTKYAIKDRGRALLHKSQIQKKYVDDVSKILKIGQKIRPRVITINYDTKEVGVSLREKRPARKPVADMQVGDEMEGRVKSVESYGAFVDIGCKSDALLHISRISFDKIVNVEDHVKKGDKITVHIISVDQKKKTLAVSMLPQVADEYLDRRNKNRKIVKVKEEE